MQNNYSNFSIKNLFGGIKGSSAGITFESLGFLVGIPGAGTGFWTYAAACKGDAGCEKKVQDWWNKNKPSIGNGPNLSNQNYGIESQLNTTQDWSNEISAKEKKIKNTKTALIIGGSLIGISVIGYFIYKNT